jgi:hypothetical protein
VYQVEPREPAPHIEGEEAHIEGDDGPGGQTRAHDPGHLSARRHAQRVGHILGGRDLAQLDDIGASGDAERRHHLAEALQALQAVHRGQAAHEVALAAPALHQTQPAQFVERLTRRHAAHAEARHKGVLTGELLATGELALRDEVDQPIADREILRGFAFRHGLCRIDRGQQMPLQFD